MHCKLVHLPDLSPRITLLFVFLILLYSPATGQSAFKGYSASFKMGTYNNFNENQGLTASAEFKRFIGNTIYSVDYIYAQEFTLFDPVPDDVFNQIGFMAGKYFGSEFFRIEYLGGLAPAFGKFYSERKSGTPGTSSYRYYEEDKFFTVGLAAKLGLKIVPLKFVSGGIDVLANLNLKHPLIFTSLSLEIGRLKN